MSDIDVIQPPATDTADDSTEKTSSNSVNVGNLVSDIDSSKVLISWIKEHSELLQQANPQSWHKDNMLNKQVGQLQQRVGSIIAHVKGIMGDLGATNQDSHSDSSESSEKDNDKSSKITQLDATSVDLLNQKVQELSQALDSVCHTLGDKFDLPHIKQAQQFLIKFPDQMSIIRNAGLQKNEKTKEARRQKQEKKKGIIRRKWEQLKTVVLRKKNKNENERVI